MTSPSPADVAAVCASPFRDGLDEDEWYSLTSDPNSYTPSLSRALVAAVKAHFTAPAIVASAHDEGIDLDLSSVPVEDITLANFWLTTKGTETDRRVWDAIASTGLRVNDVLIAFEHIRGGLQELAASADRVVKFVPLTLDQQKIGMTAKNLGSLPIGPYTALFLLQNIGDGKITVSQSGLTIMRLGQKCHIGHTGLTLDGDSKFSVIFDKCTIAKKNVTYSSVPGLFHATRLFFQYHELVYTAGMGWRVFIDKDVDSKGIVAQRSDVKRMLPMAIEKALKSVADDIKLAVATVEQLIAAHRGDAAKCLFEALPNIDITQDVYQKLRDTIVFHNTDAGVRANFSYHAANEKVRNTPTRLPAWSNNASAYAAAPGMVKQGCEISELLEYYKTISLTEDLPTDLYVVSEGGYEPSWRALAERHDFRIANQTLKGPFAPLPSSLRKHVLIDHAFVPANTMVTRLAYKDVDSAPEAHIMRVRGDAIQLSEIKKEIEERLPDHWKSVRVFQLGNLHNTGVYVAFSRVAPSKHNAVDELKATSSPEQLAAAVSRGGRYFSVKPSVGLTDPSAFAMSGAFAAGVRKVAYMAALHEAAIMHCYRNGVKYTLKNMDQLLDLMNVDQKAHCFKNHYSITGARIEYSKLGSDVSSTSTGQIQAAKATTDGPAVPTTVRQRDYDVEEEDPVAHDKTEAT